MSCRCFICRISGSRIGRTSHIRVRPRSTAICRKPGGGSRNIDETGVTSASASFGSPGLPPASEAETLDALFRRNARRRPDAIALVDPPDRPAFTEGIARRLTYGEADRAVQTLAMRLQMLELPAGAVVALQLPNTMESIIALLAVLRAGFVAAPVPLLWRTEAVRALGHVGARALIACPRLGRTDYNELALNIAAETFSIRFVCGLGEYVPDGMVPLGDIFAANSPTLPALAPSPHEFADATAVLTFEMGLEGLAAMPHQQTELLVGGLAVVLEAAMQRNAVL